jgi:hypothetical protein
VADALVELAWLDLASGDAEAAVSNATEAHERASATGQSILAGLALVALASAHEARGDTSAAAAARVRAAEVLQSAGHRGVRDRPNGL